MKNDKFVSDTETGGFDAQHDGLCSIAIKSFNMEPKLHLFIKPNPNLNYNPKALEVNGLTLEHLETVGISEEETINRIRTFFTEHLIEKPSIIGQNIQFDIKFLEALFVRNDAGRFSDLINYHVIDTYPITKALKDARKIQIIDCKLGTAYTHFTGKEPKNAHDAMADVLMTEELYNSQLKFLEGI